MPAPKVITMRQRIFVLFLVLLLSPLAGCGDDAARPAGSRGDNTVQGEIGESDFEFDIPPDPGDPLAGPFRLRGTNLHYEDDAGVLVVDLTVRNLGSYPHREPIGLTFIQLDPDEVTVVNPDNDIHDDGAAIVFQFANDDAIWTPDETSLPRTVQFSVTKGVSIAFVARLDLGPAIDGGAIAGRVWNDTNQNGVLEDDEHGVAGTGVYLHSFSGDSTSTREFGYTVTDRDGHYVFRPLRAGGYVVTIGPSTHDCTPTTPTEIHVLLVEVDGEVSSYRNANFGCVPNEVPPPWEGNRVVVTGKFTPGDLFYANGIDHVTCPFDSTPDPLRNTDPPVVPECEGGRLRGGITEIAPTRSAFRVMATWVIDATNIAHDLKVGDRVDVHVDRAPGAATWIADSIERWDAEHDELHGIVDVVEQYPDGTVRLRVLDTWVVPADVTVGKRSAR